jgi:hypothetical protein
MELPALRHMKPENMVFDLEWPVSTEYSRAIRIDFASILRVYCKETLSGAHSCAPSFPPLYGTIAQNHGYTQEV